MATVDSSATEQTTNRGRSGGGGQSRDLTQRMNVHARAVAVGTLIALIGIGAFGRFYTARFNGLVTPEAMEVGDIAQNLRYHNSFSTRVVRPLALSHATPDARGAVPATRHQPLYPLLLSVLFRVRGGGDASIAMFNGLMFLLTGWVVYAIARMLWDKIIALLSVAMYFISIDAISAALSGVGISLAALLGMMATGAALRGRKAAEAETADDAEPAGGPSVVWPVVVGAAMGLAWLASSTAILLLVPLAVLVSTPGRARWRQIGITVLIAAVVISPWLIRNFQATGTPAPVLAAYEVMTHTGSHPAETVYQKTAAEVGSPMAFVFSHPREMARKFAGGLAAMYRGIPRMLNPYLFPFFILAAFLFTESALHRSLWRVAVAMIVVQMVSVSVYGLDTQTMSVLLPLTLCISVAALVLILRRSRLGRHAQILVGALVVGLVLFPTAGSAILGGKAPAARARETLSVLSEGLAEDAVIATDDPAAVAWYAGRQAVLLPSTPDGLAKLAERGIQIDYVYLSSRLNEVMPGSTVEEWGKLLSSEEAVEQLGKPIRLPHGEMLFERVDES